MNRAARFIYLNRTCWNGLYRVNLSGRFNVPLGTKTNVLLPTDNFIHASRALTDASLQSCDFERTIDRAGRGDFIFADPPYTVRHNNNGFIKYNQQIFSWDDQIRLRDSLWRAHLRGAKVLLTNANHTSVVQLYEDFPVVQALGRNSLLSADTQYRGSVEELLVRSWT